MFPYDSNDIILLVSTSLALLGAISIVAGIFLLLFRAAGKDVQTVATQATRLAQKGLAEEVAGLVGNASALVDALNQLARTSAGIGIFLVIFGFIMLIVSFFIVRSF